MDDLNTSDPPPTSVEVSRTEAGTVVVAIVGELDLSSIPEVEEKVRSAFRDRPTGVVVDLSGLTFADSSAIALWVRWSMTFSSFELRHPPPPVRRVIAVMGLSERLGTSE